MTALSPLPSLFDLGTHAANREDGIARAAAGSSDAWKSAAAQAIHACAYCLGEFTADEVWEALDRLGHERPANPCALGPVFRNVMHHGHIAKTGKFRESRQVTNHRVVTVWKAA